MTQQSRISLTILIAILLPVAAWSQANNDTSWVVLPDSVAEKEHSPKKAALMSACLPGLGQAYNKKYWKIPVVYAGFGVMGYFIYFNADLYKDYKRAYIESSEGNFDGDYADLVNRYSQDELLSAREYYRRNLEISCLITAVWYVLNILDAAVDAHLHTFNISENLSVNISPSVLPTRMPGKTATGITLSLNF